MEFPLPQVSEALKPYIKTRQEALHIRRILTLYLASNIEGLPNGKLSSLSLAPPDEHVSVKHIPANITGLRRDYLLALQANIKARNEYRSISERVSKATDISNDERNQQIGRESPIVNDYVELLAAQRKHEKLNTLNEYAKRLGEKAAAKRDFLTVESVRDELGPAPQLPRIAEDGTASLGRKGSEIQDLTTRLEKALLRANSSLEKERRLLAETKANHQEFMKSATAKEPTAKDRVYALSRTRDELISWIEDKLARINEQDEEPAEEQISESEDRDIAIEQSKVNIQKHYNDYLDARRRIIEFSEEKRTLSALPSPSAQQTKRPEAVEATPSEHTLQPSVILPYVTEYLIPAADAQKALHQQEQYILNSLTAQNKATLKTLNKLADESHLLASYPMEANQQQLQPDTTALGGPNLLSPLRGRSANDGQSDLAEKGRMWAYAAEEARLAKNAALEKRLAKGEKHAEAAQVSLRELQSFIRGGEEEGEESERGKASRSSKRSPWTGVDGRVGTEP